MLKDKEEEQKIRCCKVVDPKILAKKLLIQKAAGKNSLKLGLRYVNLNVLKTWHSFSAGERFSKITRLCFMDCFRGL